MKLGIVLRGGGSGGGRIRRELYGGMIRVDVRKSFTWGAGSGIRIGVSAQLGSWCECINIISG